MEMETLKIKKEIKFPGSNCFYFPHEKASGPFAICKRLTFRRLLCYLHCPRTSKWPTGWRAGFSLRGISSVLSVRGWRALRKSEGARPEAQKTQTPVPALLSSWPSVSASDGAGSTADPMAHVSPARGCPKVPGVCRRGRSRSFITTITCGQAALGVGRALCAWW